MKSSTSKPQFILLFAFLITHTLAELSEEATNNASKAWRPRYHEARLSARADQAHLDAIDSNWAGAVQQAPSADRMFTFVSAVWTIPSIALPTGAAKNTQYHAALWVGVDGYTGSRCADRVIQAGVLSLINTDDNGNVKNRGVLLFTQWYPAAPPTFYNPNVAPGHRIQVDLLANSPSQVQVTFSDPDSDSEGVSKTINAPNDNFLICGGTAEWIMEASGSLSALANFGSIDVGSCFATLGTQGKDTIEEIDLDGAGFVNINYNGEVVAKSTKVDSDTLNLLYTGP